jgi:D-lyxose ketol-isomerase
VQFYPSREDGSLGTDDVDVVVDSAIRTIPAGSSVLLSPGESVSVPRFVYHSFWAVDAPCVAGEVSSVNEDIGDNVFFEPLGRFPAIEEDEVPLHLILGDYPSLELV